MLKCFLKCPCVLTFRATVIQATFSTKHNNQLSCTKVSNAWKSMKKAELENGVLGLDIEGDEIEKLKEEAVFHAACRDRRLMDVCEQNRHTTG